MKKDHIAIYCLSASEISSHPWPICFIINLWNIIFTRAELLRELRAFYLSGNWINQRLLPQWGGIDIISLCISCTLPIIEHDINMHLSVIARSKLPLFKSLTFNRNEFITSMSFLIGWLATQTSTTNTDKIRNFLLAGKDFCWLTDIFLSAIYIQR